MKKMCRIIPLFTHHMCSDTGVKEKVGLSVRSYTQGGGLYAEKYGTLGNKTIQVVPMLVDSLLHTNDKMTLT